MSESFPFCHALRELKAGRAVRRACWQPGALIHLMPGCIDGDRLSEAPIEGVPACHFKAWHSGTATRLPVLAWTTPLGTVMPGFIVSIAEMLAEDWQLVGEASNG